MCFLSFAVAPRVFSFLAVQFGLVLGFQLHQFTLMFILHSLDFILQPPDGFLMRGNLVTQILDFTFQGFRLARSPTDSGTQKLAPLSPC